MVAVELGWNSTDETAPNIAKKAKKKSAQISNNQNNSSEINSNGQNNSNPEKMPTLSMFLSVCLTTQFTKQQ